MADPADLSLPPLPRGLADAVAELLQSEQPLAPATNPGLVFERYPCLWQVDEGSWDLGPGRLDFLRNFTRCYARLEPSFMPLLRGRLQALAAVFGTGREYEARWRFVTGVGAEHPLESGFAFHRLFGVPFLPGSTVKGLVRVAARLFGAEEEDEHRLLGPPPPKSGQDRLSRTGELIFLDALPVRWPQLAVDLVNNHHPTWTAFLNQGRANVGPIEAASAAGLEDPVPVYFLAAEPGLKLRFWIAPRPGSKLADNDLNRSWSWLEEGLRYLGIGAKTAVGYGRFGVAEDAETSYGSMPAPPQPLEPPPRFSKGDRVRFVLTGQSKKGKWQGHLAAYSASFGTLLGESPPDAAVGREYEVIVGVAADLMNLNLRWP
jgi:CRISPR/Cas system CMR subunit Cmr6 (Cas7 group RAMP superfamily)